MKTLERCQCLKSQTVCPFFWKTPLCISFVWLEIHCCETIGWVHTPPFFVSHYVCDFVGIVCLQLPLCRLQKPLNVHTSSSRNEFFLALRKRISGKSRTVGYSYFTPFCYYYYYYYHHHCYCYYNHHCHYYYYNHHRHRHYCCYYATTTTTAATTTTTTTTTAAAATTTKTYSTEAIFE